MDSSALREERQPQCAFCQWRHICGLPYGNTCIPDPISYCLAAHPPVLPSLQQWRPVSVEEGCHGKIMRRIPWKWQRRHVNGRRAIGKRFLKLNVAPERLCYFSRQNCALGAITYLWDFTQDDAPWLLDCQPPPLFFIQINLTSCCRRTAQVQRSHPWNQRQKAVHAPRLSSFNL